MQTWLVWTRSPVTESDLRAFAEEQDGHWNDLIGGEAIIERGRDRVFVATSERASDDFPDDVDYAAKRLGAMPVSALSIRIGHSEGSVALAEKVAKEALARWGGFLDRGEGE